MEEDGLAFTKFEWSITPKDPNDRLVCTLVSSSVKLEECDAVQLGLPFDGATLGRLGASEGPKALRAAARMLKVHRFGGPPPRFTEHVSGASMAGVAAVPVPTQD